MAEELLKPGEKAPQAGVYQVRHYRHRLQHEVTILEEQLLPPCRTCGESVRFLLLRSAMPVEADADFKPPPALGPELSK